jgi:transcriptional regulator with XRE-family HTH domain
MKEYSAQVGESLGEFVKRVRAENKWSTRDVARQADYEISDSYVSMIENETAQNPSPKLIKALAKGLKLDPEIFQKILYGTLPTSGLTESEQILVTRYRQADERAQADIDLLVRVLSKARPIQELPFEPTEDDFEEVQPQKSSKTTKEVRQKRTKPQPTNK